MKNTRRTAVIVLCVLMIVSMLAGCYTLGERKPIATLKFSNGAEIEIRLYPDKAPNTVNNFIYLANSGFYDGSPIHRIKEYFVVQMGRPGGDSGEMDAGYTIYGEFPNNGFSKNDLTHDTGTVSMARVVNVGGEQSSDYYNSASSEFFICLELKPSLDGDYAAFGKVIRGMKEVEKISKMDVDANQVPRDEIYIESLRVETYGKNYPAPNTLPKEDD